MFIFSKNDLLQFFNYFSKLLNSSTSHLARFIFQIRSGISIKSITTLLILKCQIIRTAEYNVMTDYEDYHYVKSIRIWSYSGPHFPAFGLNTDRYEVSLRIQFQCRKMRTRISPNTDTFYAVYILKEDGLDDCNYT